MPSNVFQYIRQTRKVFAQLVEQLTPEALNAIPPGFRNNIAWNFGHIAVSTPALCYQRTQVAPDYEIPFQPGYAKGTSPEKWISVEEIDALKTQLFTSIDRIEQDYADGVFAQISPFATATYGLEMPTIEDVLTASLAHDNLHLGYAMAIRRALNKTV